MTEKQIRQKFKETYPDFMLGDEPLSPYFDIWEYAIEIATTELDDEKLTLKVRLQMYNTAEEARKDLERFVKSLKNQIDKMKCCGNCMGLMLHSFQRIHCLRCKNKSDWRLAE